MNRGLVGMDLFLEWKCNPVGIRQQGMLREDLSHQLHVPKAQLRVNFQSKPPKCPLTKDNGSAHQFIEYRSPGDGTAVQMGFCSPPTPICTLTRGSLFFLSIG